MVNMGMGKNKDIDACGVTGPLAVQFESFFALALKETAVKHYAATVDINDMLGAGNGFCSTMKCDFHYFL
jgi:hypothetical protein